MTSTYSLGLDGRRKEVDVAEEWYVPTGNYCDGFQEIQGLDSV